MTKIQESYYLFVYGTLMKAYEQGSIYLKEAEFIEEAVLTGYGLYDVGACPGIVKEEGSKVKGELYLITKDMLPALDEYEMEGELYIRECVLVNDIKGNEYKAYIYVYNCPVDQYEKIAYEDQPWQKNLDQY